MQTFMQVYSSNLTQQDMKQHIPFQIMVPEETRSFQIHLIYSPHIVDTISNLLTLTVFDPRGFRGAAHRHGNVLDVIIQDNAATPGFFPGFIQPGNWVVQIDTHMIMPGVPLQVEMIVSGSDELDAGLPAPPAPYIQAQSRASREARWYRGDLHAHSHHSDGSWDVAGLLAFAHANQLDFVTLSDHNTVSGLPELENTCPEDLLPIYGSELTTFWGHALALGRKEWVDWRIEPGKREMADIAAEVEGQDGLFIIAHPEAVGDPYCTGCRWEYGDMRPGTARVVEIWNSPWESESNNEDGLSQAYQWMQNGLRMVLTAGTDRHGQPYTAPESAFNMVFAEELSEKGILAAIRAGHVYLTSGPHILLSAQVGEKTLITGDSIQVGPGDVITVNAQWADCPPGTLVNLVVDGKTRATIKALPSSSAAWKLTGGEISWAQVCLRAAEGQMLAMSNPIYFDGR